jgi:hypothetical protein
MDGPMRGYRQYFLENIMGPSEGIGSSSSSKCIGPIRNNRPVSLDGPIRAYAHIYKKRAHDGLPEMYG